MLEGRKRKIAAQAAPHMEEGEDPRLMMLGQTYVTPWVYLLIAPIVFVFMVKPRAVLATDRNVYVLELGQFKASQVKSVLIKQRLSDADVKATRFSLTVAGEKAFAMLGQGGPMRQIADLAAAEPGGN
jgi:hypothetical protein